MLKQNEIDISIGQNALYRELLDYANDERLLDKEFVLKNSAVCDLTGLTLSGLQKARNRLTQLELIEYKPGKKDKAKPTYKIVDLTESTTNRTINRTTNGTISRTTNRTINRTTNRDTKVLTSTRPDLTNTKQENSKKNLTSSFESEKSKPHDDDDSLNSLIEFYQQNVSATSPIISQGLSQSVTDLAEKNKSKPESVRVVKYAIKLAVENGARSWKYIDKILLNWENHNLFTVANIKSAEAERERNKPSYGRQPKPKEEATNWDEKKDNTQISQKEIAELNKRLEQIHSKNTEG